MDNRTKNLMLGDFHSNNERMSKDVWNARYEKSEAKVSLATGEQLRNDPYIKDQLRIYKKGRIL